MCKRWEDHNAMDLDNMGHNYTKYSYQCGLLLDAYLFELGPTTSTEVKGVYYKLGPIGLQLIHVKWALKKC